MFFTPRTQDPVISSVVLSSLQAVGDLAYPPDYKPLPVKVADEIKDYDKTEFIDDVYDFLTGYQEQTGEFKDFTFNADFVDQIPGDSETNSLRYEIYEREYAQGAQGIRDPRWNLRDVVEDVNNPGYSVLVFTKPFENKIGLTCWSKNYRDADRFADQIEDLIDTYGKIFKAKGLQSLRFLKRGRDLFKERENHTWYGCPLIYLVKTYKVKLVYEKMLEDIAIEITTNPN